MLTVTKNLAFWCCLMLLATALTISAQVQTVQSGVAYKLRNQCSGKMLSISEASVENGALAQQWAEYNGLNQQFKVTATNNGYYALIALHSQKAVDVQNAQTADGTTVWQYAVNNTAAQQFKLLNAGDGYWQMESRLQADKMLDVQWGRTDDGAPIHLWSRNNSCAQKWKFELAGDGSSGQAKLGTNLAGVSDWTTQWSFVDAFKISRPWISQREGFPWGEGGSVKFNARRLCGFARKRAISRYRYF